MKRQRVTGKVLQQTIIELAHMYGWKVAHHPSVLVTGRDGRSSYRTPFTADTKGFPDLVLCRRHDRVMFVEVKGDGDKIRPEQDEWIRDLRSAGRDVYVWTPAHLDSGEIANLLQERL